MKLLRYGLVLFIILSLNFLIPRLMPGDPVYNLYGGRMVNLNQETIAELHAKYGLDKPLPEQYLNYLSSLARLDLGYSIVQKSSVAELIKDRLTWTIILILPSILIGDLLALATGSVAGFRRGTGVDNSLTAFSLVFYTCPAFFLSMILISLLSFHIRLLPYGSFATGGLSGFAYVADLIWHLILPVTVLSIMGFTYTFFVVRNSVSQIKDEYFVFVARSKGLAQRAVILNHVMRNVLPQFISMMALDIGFMVSGALIIEVTFSLSGMGTLIYDAVLSRDYPVLQGSFIVLTIVVLAANFLADALYGIVDPRIEDSQSDGLTDGV